MAVPDGALLQKIAEAMTAAADGPWRTSTLSVTGLAATMRIQLSIVRADGTVDQSKGPGDDALEWCDDLRDAMYSEDEGAWYNATITVSDDRQIETSFDYDNPPFPGEDVPNDLLVDDNEVYPRLANRLPDWHPSKLSPA